MGHGWPQTSFLRPFRFAGNNSIFLKPKIKVHQSAGGKVKFLCTWELLLEFPFSLSPQGTCCVWKLAMKRSCCVTGLLHNLFKALTWVWGGGVWLLAWRPLNISMPAIKYSMQWELESLQSLNYRSVLKWAFPSTELVEWNRLDQKGYGNFPLPFTSQDTYQEGDECGLKQFQRVKRFC